MSKGPDKQSANLHGNFGLSMAALSAFIAPRRHNRRKMARPFAP
jgi:hypothetical protein